ncbi:DUF2514 domain-containing protein [Hafnia paralvei]|uniref:DUF2514 domain-containing protein n=1 Tax=Hafnia paralvei TaxID=546367 RepID=UPI00163C179D|nr:DUF2514 domain-containing protein [Hafnia paralvei]
MRTIVGLLKIYWKPLTLIALVALSLWGAYSVGYDSANKSWQLKWTQRDKEDSDALARRQVEVRIEEQRRQQAINKVVQNASQQVYAAHNDAISANALASRLHQEANKLVQRLEERERACSSPFTPGGQTESGAQLLAELFKRADEEAGRMAKIADESRIRGDACTKAYNQLQTY